jgi:GDP-4-dehydro-6-deoxy-D-mannose reductase
LNLLEAVRHTGIKPRILVTCSAEGYGASANKVRFLDESAPFAPLNPYSVSKVAQDLLAHQYFLALGQKVVRTRAFSHTGPGQNDSFVAGSFAKQVALIEAGRQKPVIRVGNLKAIRDFTDVRDVVRAYALALEKGKAGEAYNVCSGKGRRISELLDIYLSESSVKIKVKHDPGRQRAGDIPRLVGNPKKFINATGWKPEIPFEQTLRDVLDYWRERVKRVRR